MDRAADDLRYGVHKPPAPDAPNIIVLDKKTGRLVATDDARISEHLLHGQWSSLSLGTVNGRKLLFYGGGDGVCYAFEALAKVPGQPVKLKTVWTYDCIPPEYRSYGEMDWLTHFYLGDRRNRFTLNQNDGAFVGLSTIIATPVFHENRVYVAIGRDPEHGRGRGALHCIDATRTGEISQSGRIWCYQGLDRTLATVSIADGLLYAGDVAGRLHCLDLASGKCHWVHEGHASAVASSLVADGKVYFPTEKHLWVLAAGTELKVLGQMRLGATTWSTPVAANGTLYIATSRGQLMALSRQD